jgi:glutamate 5-kinase
LCEASGRQGGKQRSHGESRIECKSDSIHINLTDIDGLYTSDPRVFPGVEMIPLVPTINKNIEKLASDIPGALGSGGMLSKIKAA